MATGKPLRFRILETKKEGNVDPFGYLQADESGGLVRFEEHAQIAKELDDARIIAEQKCAAASAAWGGASDNVAKLREKLAQYEGLGKPVVLSEGGEDMMGVRSRPTLFMSSDFSPGKLYAGAVFMPRIDELTSQNESLRKSLADADRWRGEALAEKAAAVARLEAEVAKERSRANRLDRWVADVGCGRATFDEIKAHDKARVRLREMNAQLMLANDVNRIACETLAAVTKGVETGNALDYARAAAQDLKDARASLFSANAQLAIVRQKNNELDELNRTQAATIRQQREALEVRNVGAEKWRDELSRRHQLAKAFLGSTADVERAEAEIVQRHKEKGGS